MEFIDDDGVENSWSVLDQNAFLNHFFIVPNLKTNKKKTNFYIHRFSHAWNCDVRSLKHHLETKKENKDKNSSKHSVTWIVMVIWQVFCYWKRKKKERQVYLLGCLSIYVLDQLMLDDYTIEELSSDEFDNMKRFQEKQTSLDLSRTSLI